jgi:mono/diheme cytochrome c family protein
VNRVGAIVVAAASAFVAIGACSDKSPASPDSGTDSGGIVDCPDDIPAACPASPPTYAKDIAPVIQGSCATCHTPGGRQPDRLLTNYDEVFAQRGVVLTQVNACRMPPRDAPPLSAEARKALLAWLVCGAQNN